MGSCSICPSEWVDNGRKENPMQFQNRLPVTIYTKYIKRQQETNIYIYFFVLFFCLLLHSLAVRISLLFHIFLQFSQPQNKQNCCGQTQTRLLRKICETFRTFSNSAFSTSSPGFSPILVPLGINSREGVILVSRATRLNFKTTWPRNDGLWGRGRWQII